MQRSVTMNLTDMDTEEAFRNDHETISGEDPFAMFGEWLELAHRKEINDANAMALATTGPDGLPNVRMVLLKGFDSEGFVFYTNTESQKGVELAENMQAAAVLHWKSLRRQVRFRGSVSRVSAEEADAYFVSRARASRIGAWASRQSRPLDHRTALAKSVAAEVVRFGVGEIPRPAFWTGFRIVPNCIEFWMDKPFRLHDRLVFRRSHSGDPWSALKLYP
ncbi:pyridoxamine 5'-phosphate oxidase (plasmid) [Ralstonia solanacearum]|uniref:Pyridoxine/pyridoxamine 5'-phosphate oxidase n=4 Tax=Ralstonia TaxID=48736 RepID=A0AAD0WI61_RALSL|nr:MULTISPECIES: pyridoxamine 5'-phosphate oxidase [Ralstonia solanacearum species complex]AXV83704.1 pyridoxamine 5'-phosphate oxidase [Ralstonia solanacearum]AXW54837.1 pyridoxamine 5'-phosphate oxidase [Ralstonia solanacearum]AXW63927.1 pyridoxamine 5'-phosphate oxidase [Ralstonia solanacearum]QUP55886.1 pyridoxamine 5'-phosphate oxidase [Ralstonia syzygii]